MSESPEVPAALLSTLTSFAAAHGGPGTAVVEYVGRGRARVVVVGTDGIWGDEVVSDVETGKAAAEAAGFTVTDSWDRELTAALKTTEADWLRMGGRRARLARR